MSRRETQVAAVGLLLVGNLLGFGLERVAAQEVIVPHSKGALYNIGRSYYIPPQVSASPAMDVGSSNHPAYSNPYSAGGMNFGGWGGGWGMYRRMPWGPMYQNGQGPYSAVPTSL